MTEGKRTEPSKDAELKKKHDRSETGGHAQEVSRDRKVPPEKQEEQKDD